MDEDRVRCLVLAGWLGSGKTTLLNELLADAIGSGGGSGERVAVIVNDIGDINVDAALIAKADGERIELTDGCICCSIGSSLALTLRDLIMVDDPPDLIVIEASGVAEPAKVAAYGDRRKMREPAIVVTVDAADVLERSVDERFGAMVRAQVAQADALVVTKRDLIDSAQSARVDRWLDEVVPTTPIIDRADVRRFETAGADRADRHEPVADARAVSAEVETRTITFGDGNVKTISELEQFLAATDGLVRAKGVLRLQDGSYVVLHHAGSSISYDPLPIPSPQEVAIAQQIVLIVALSGNSSPTGDQRL